MRRLEFSEPGATSVRPCRLVRLPRNALLLSGKGTANSLGPLAAPVLPVVQPQPAAEEAGMGTGRSLRPRK